MKNDNNSAIDKDDDYEFCSLHEPFYLSHTFYNGRQQVIGKMDARYGGMWWTPATGETSYCLAPTELDAIIRAHCEALDRKTESTEFYCEYVPLRPTRALPFEELTEVHMEKLSVLSARMTKIEEQLVRELFPQVQALQARVDDPEDWLQDFECDITLRFYVGADDPDYDEENSDNVLITREHGFDLIHDLYNSRVVEGINWNMYEQRDGCSMRDEIHCWLFHDLYDHTHIGWANLLRIDNVRIDVTFLQQRWETGLCRK